MSLAGQISSWTMPQSYRATKKEIHEEMQFHVECRVEELIDSGMSRGDAQKLANQEFGDRKAIQNECHRIRMGIQPWINISAIVGGLVLLAIIAWLAVSLTAIQAKNELLEAQLASSISTPPTAFNTAAFTVTDAPDESPQDYDESLKGKITDEEGNGIKGAKILLVHKSWPGGQYTQQVFDTETDEDGKYSFDEQYSTDMQNAFLVSVFAEGKVFESRYTVVKKGRDAKDFNFKLKAGAEVEYTFTDEDGKALAETAVYISSRKIGRKEHMTYFQSADSATWETDEDGKLKLGFFAKGDKVTVNLLVDGEWQETEFKVGKEAKQTVVAKKK